MDHTKTTIKQLHTWSKTSSYLIKFYVTVATVNSHSKTLWSMVSLSLMALLTQPGTSYPSYQRDTTSDNYMFGHTPKQKEVVLRYPVLIQSWQQKANNNIAVLDLFCKTSQHFASSLNTLCTL